MVSRSVKSITLRAPLTWLQWLRPPWNPQKALDFPLGRYSASTLTRATPSWWSSPCRSVEFERDCSQSLTIFFFGFLQAFWGLVTMLLLVFGAWVSTPGSGSFLGAVSLELRDEDGAWAFFAGVKRSGTEWMGELWMLAACFAHIMPAISSNWFTKTAWHDGWVYNMLVYNAKKALNKNEKIQNIA